MSLKKHLPHWLINYGKHLPAAILANLKYGWPGKKLKVIGVTGTDGKTTTVNMIYQILKDAEKSVSMVSTINADVAGKKYDTGFHVTSPHPKVIQKFLSDSVKHGDEYFVLEVTSHALDQFRVWGIPFEVGVITNITHEHLDYHGTFKKYLEAKAKLLRNCNTAVLNRDDENYEYLRKQSKSNVITFGLSREADYNQFDYDYQLKIPGVYNLKNALAATAVTNQLGINEKDIKKSLESFIGLSGRMEQIENDKGLNIVVDFAHTPSALENVLETLKKSTGERLISVFGCASERDTAKRPIMGKVSVKIADITVLTSEDPRMEDPNQIIDQIAQGSLTHGAKLNHTLFKESDRQSAINLAVSMAKPGDTIGIFGKGHEQTMNIKGYEVPWSDQTAVQKALNKARSKQ